MNINVTFEEQSNNLDLDFEQNNSEEEVTFDNAIYVNLDKVIDVIVKDGETQQSVVGEDHKAIIDLTDYAKDSDVQAEATARANADTAEATTRANADTNLSNLITNETTARTNADTALSNAISTETSQRTAADTVETNARQAADTAEREARDRADGILAGRIDTETANRETTDNVILNKIKFDVQLKRTIGQDISYNGNVVKINKKFRNLNTNTETTTEEQILLSNDEHAGLMPMGAKTVTQAEKDAWNAKQNAITPENKLSADLIQNGNTNKVFTATDKENLDSNTAARHSHSNKALLDSYTQTESNLADAVSKKHSHSNKTLLDSYTQTEANLADAVSKKHSHSNKTILDNLTQDVIDNSHSHSNKALLDTYDQTNANITDAVSKKHSHSNKTILDNLTQGVIDNSHSHTNKSVLDGIASTNLVSSGDRTNWNGKTSINDSSTTSTTETWSANKLQSVLGDIEATLQSIRGVS